MMTTFEMMKEAEKTGKTYIIDDMRYSVKKGFHDDYGDEWDANAFDVLNDVMNLSGWKVLDLNSPPRKMTLVEIENELGFRIELVNGN